MGAATRLALAIAFAALAGACSGQVASKYLGQHPDDPAALFLDETGELVTGALMMRYGQLVPFEGTWDVGVLRGELLGVDPATQVVGRRRGQEFSFALIQGRERQEYTLRLPQLEPQNYDTPFLRMLSLVPDGLQARTGTPGVSYVDFRAVERAAGAVNPGSADRYRALSEAERDTWSNALRRVNAGPSQLLENYEVQIERVPEILGFEWFAMDRALNYGYPPQATVVVAVEPDSQKFAARLSERGFETRDLAGTTVWLKGEEGALSVELRDAGDPFDANLGLSQRIALLDGHLIHSAFLAPLAAVARVGADEAPSLAQAPDYLTLAEVAEDPATGELLQAMFLSPLEVGLLPLDPLSMMGVEEPEVEGAPADATPLPYYGLALLVDKQSGDQRVGVIALLYEDLATAELAAGELDRRLTDFIGAATDLGSFSSDGALVHRSETGLFAAVSVIRFTGVSGPEEEDGFVEWVSAIMRREFPVLAIPGVR